MTDSEISILLMDHAPAFETVQGPYRPGEPMAFVELPDKDKAEAMIRAIVEAYESKGVEKAALELVNGIKQLRVME